MRRLSFPEKVTVKEGYFPETFDLYDEQFLFVSLDVDLYEPTKAGLEIFYPRMTKGGVILIDDYFSNTYLAVKKIVDEFCMTHNIPLIPIGDNYGVVIVKQ
jgi:predicted O-methyltransferase YrrM